MNPLTWLTVVAYLDVPGIQGFPLGHGVHFVHRGLLGTGTQQVVYSENIYIHMKHAEQISIWPTVLDNHAAKYSASVHDTFGEQILISFTHRWWWWWWWWSQSVRSQSVRQAGRRESVHLTNNREPKPGCLVVGVVYSIKNENKLKHCIQRCTLFGPAFFELSPLPIHHTPVWRKPS